MSVDQHDLSGLQVGEVTMPLELTQRERETEIAYLEKNRQEIIDTLKEFPDSVFFKDQLKAHDVSLVNQYKEYYDNEPTRQGTATRPSPKRQRSAKGTVAKAT